MNLADIKEKLVETVTPYWERIQESDQYQQISEQYESLSPRNQKFVKIGALVSVGFGYLFFIYFMFLSTAMDSIYTFESNQKLIRDLFTVNRKVSSQPKAPEAIPVDRLKLNIEQEMTNMQILPEQKVAVTPATFSMGNLGPKELIAQGLTVDLKQLTIRQIVEMAYNLQSIPMSPAKLLGMEINSYEKDSHYFNVKYSLAMFSLPEQAAPVKDNTDKNKSKTPTGRRGSDKTEPDEKPEDDE